MSNSIERENQRRLEILSGSVLGDLSAPEAHEMEVWDSAKNRQTVFELERTAAAVQLAMMTDQEPLPKSIQSRVMTDAQNYFREAKAKPPESNIRKPSVANIDAGPNRRETLAWLACAASLALAVGMLAYSNRPPTPRPTAAAQRTELVSQATDLVTVSWSPGKTPFNESVGGDVVWSNEAQKGFMRFTNMPVNDPTVEQYQLWIIDPQRDDEPIDGGVFDIPEDGEVIVPIDAKLAVLEPAAFAITIEKPGGVVVSTQERLPLLAAVK